MKKTFTIVIILVCACIFLFGCSSKYKKSADIPKDYPDELEIYDDAIIFEVVEEDDKIEIKYGTKDSMEDVADFYIKLMKEVRSTAFVQNENKNNYIAEGWGVYYTFKIKAGIPTDKREQRNFETVVTVNVTVSEDKIDLMKNMQGYWAYAGDEQGYQKHVNRYGTYYYIEDGIYMHYENCEPIYDEAYVFFAGEGVILVEGEQGLLPNESCGVRIEKNRWYSYNGNYE